MALSTVASSSLECIDELALICLCFHWTRSVLTAVLYLLQIVFITTVANVKKHCCSPEDSLYRELTAVKCSVLVKWVRNESWFNQDYWTAILLWQLSNCSIPSIIYWQINAKKYTWSCQRQLGDSLCQQQHSHSLFILLWIRQIKCYNGLSYIMYLKASLSSISSSI